MKKGFFGSKGSTRLSDKEIADQIYIEASKEKTLGEYEKAITLYKTCLELPGDKAAIYYEMAQIYFEIGKYIEAKKLVQQARISNPQNKWYHLFLIKVGKKTNDFGSVEEGYQSLIKNDAKNVEYLEDLGMLYIKTRRYDKALKQLDKIEDIIGVSEFHTKKKYLIYYQRRDFNKASAELEKLISTYPAKMEYYQYLGDVYLDQDKDDLAKKTWNRALAISPDDVFIFHEMANYYYKKDNNDSAFYYFNKVMLDIEFPEKEKISILKKLLHFSSNSKENKERMEALFKGSSEAHPNSFYLQELEGKYLFDIKKFEEARAKFRAAIKVRANSFTTWRSYILCDFQLDEYDSLIVHSEEALELFPTQTELYYYAGLGNYKKDNFESSITYLEEGLGLVLSNRRLKSQFLSLLGDACNSAKQYEKSDQYFEEALAVDSNDYYVMNNYAYYLSLRSDKLERAEALSRRSIELKPKNPSFLDTYGWILYQKKDYEGAVKWLSKANEHSEEPSSTIIEHIGDAYKKLNDFEKARQYWKKALELDPNSESLKNKIRKL